MAVALPHVASACFFLAELDKVNTLSPDAPLVFGNCSNMARRENLSMAERWLSVEEISAHLGVSPDTIYKWVYRKHMPSHKVGRLWKFLASEVDSWVKQGRAGRREK